MGYLPQVKHSQSINSLKTFSATDDPGSERPKTGKLQYSALKHANFSPPLSKIIKVLEFHKL